MILYICKIKKDSSRIQQYIPTSLQLARLIVTEGATRAAHQATTEGADTVTLQHMEKILAQLVCHWAVLFKKLNL